MAYLLDTNVVCETTRKKPNANVIKWIKKIPHDSLYISVLTIGEIRKGIDRLEDQSKKRQLQLWLDSKMAEWFEDNLLDIDIKIAERWGQLMRVIATSEARKQSSEVKLPISVIDTLLAATALHCDLTLVTRNAKDFDFPGLEVLNPWD